MRRALVGPILALLLSAVQVAPAPKITVVSKRALSETNEVCPNSRICIGIENANGSIILQEFDETNDPHIEADTSPQLCFPDVNCRSCEPGAICISGNAKRPIDLSQAFITMVPDLSHLGPMFPSHLTFDPDWFPLLDPWEPMHSWQPIVPGIDLRAWLHGALILAAEP